MKKYCFGIDVGGTTIKCGLFRTDGTLLEKWEIPTRRENKGEQILSDAASAINAKIKEKALDKAEIAGVGIGIPGPVNEQGEAGRAVNLYWGFKEVTRELSELTGLKSRAGNDATVAALGESWKGAAAGAKNMILVTLGTGVGGGIIIDGKIHAGSHGAGGEIGHVKVDYDLKEKCNCGNCGCLEQFASATGIVRVARQMLDKAEASGIESSLHGHENLTAKAVLDAYKEGDRIAVEIMELVGLKLGSAMAGFAAVTDPETIVIGGGVSKAGQPLLDLLTKYFRENAFPECKNTPIVIATLGNDAGIYGAARMVLE